MERLSNEGMPGPRYTVVVIGSGYGGAIAASRIARVKAKAGQPKPTVCVIERGKEWGLGDFPDTTGEALEQMQIDGPAGHVGSELGLFDFRVNDDINVLIGCGLGGTSLINANVSIGPDARVFEDTRWPREIREEFARDSGLTRGYNRARAMLKPALYEKGEYAPLKKMTTLREAAERSKVGGFVPAEINVNFQSQVNHAGVFQPECNRCGDCVSGCNTGAKNTLMMNYLPDARRHGAEIYTELAVRFIEKEDDGWTVHYQPVGAGRDKFDAPEMFVRAEIVIVAAGSLGSTEILLRSADRGLRVSNRVGSGFTGNGDVLGFGYNNDVPVNGIGCGAAEPRKDDAPGPCITGIIDARTRAPDLNKGFIVEEGSVPGAVAAFIPAGLAIGAKLLGKDTDAGMGDWLKEQLRVAESLLRGPRSGAVRNTQVYLVMAHDGSDGTMQLRDDRLRILWEGVGSREIFRDINQCLERCTGAHGGTYVKSPTWNKLMGHDLVTVHPLGGCGMGDHAGAGVVNHASQVFSESAGSAVHKGLYVMDGAVLSRSVGVNPLLTISALAERSCELLARDRGWEIDYTLLTPRPGTAPDGVERRRAGVRFTETMSGELFMGVKQAAPEILRAKQGTGTPMKFTLTVSVPDVEARTNDGAIPGRLDGTVAARALSNEPALTATGGEFALFAELGADAPEWKRMRYRFMMQAEDGTLFAFEGDKHVHDDAGFDMWGDLTTLYVTVRGVDRATGTLGDVVGCALLRIEPADFVRQMKTMSVTNARNRTQWFETLGKFVAFFGGAVLQSFGGILVAPRVVDDKSPAREQRTLRAPTPQDFFFTTADNVRLRLRRYQGGRKGPVLLSHGLGVSSRIFSIDTIDTNLVEHLVAHGYDVWLLDYRASISLVTSRQQFSGDDIARYDYPAAVAEIRRVTGAPSVQLVSHCFGASTTTMSLLGGHLKDVRSVVLSQVSLDVVAPPLTRVKTGLHVPDVLDFLGIGRLDAAADEGEGWVGRVIDRVLAVQPIQLEERCKSATCHRITFMYAPLYEHDQLNDATHDVLHEMFGEANMRSFIHLGAICRAGKLVSVTGADVYAPHLDRLNLPITFISGEENACFLPESTMKTYETLRRVHGAKQYRRHVIPSYGHIDCMFGKNASQDVFPYIVESLEAWQ